MASPTQKAQSRFRGKLKTDANQVLVQGKLCAVFLLWRFIRLSKGPIKKSGGEITIIIIITIILSIGAQIKSFLAKYQVWCLVGTWWEPARPDPPPPMVVIGRTFI